MPQGVVFRRLSSSTRFWLPRALHEVVIVGGCPVPNEAWGVGASLLRREDERHLHGHGEFVSDIKLPGTMEVAFLRSIHAHARIRSIAVPPKAAGPVFTAADLPQIAPVRVVTRAIGAISARLSLSASPRRAPRRRTWLHRSRSITSCWTRWSTRFVTCAVVLCSFTSIGAIISTSNERSKAGTSKALHARPRSR